MVQQALDKYGRIDVLYNNAAVNHYGKAVDTTLEDWNRVFSIMSPASSCAVKVLSR